MASLQIQSLGQESPVPVTGQPIITLPEESMIQMGTVWNYLYDQCEALLSPAQCRQLLGYRPIVLTEKDMPLGLKWYWWLIIGMLLGRVTKIL
jgi:hypothetical protein